MTDPQQTLLSSWRRLAQTQPQHPALCLPGERMISFAALLAMVEATGVLLSESGLVGGARLGLWFSAQPDAALATIGISSWASAVLLDPSWPPAQAASRVRDLRLNALVAREGDASAAALAHAVGLPLLPFAPERLPTPRPQHDTPAADDVAFVLLTSGTTGQSKAVPLSHRGVLAGASNFAAHFRLGPSDRSLLLMPVMHSHGLQVGLLAPLLAGGTVAVPSDLTEDALRAALVGRPATWLSASPAVYLSLLPVLQRLRAQGLLAGLRFARVTSAPITAADFARVRQALGTQLVETYGMSEATTIAAGPFAEPLTAPPSPPDAADTSIEREAASATGRFVHLLGYALRIVDAAGEPLPVGQVGEIVLRGPSVFRGYEGEDPAQTFFPDGWFRTGDLGRIDAEGALQLVGRSKEVINKGGEKISPHVIESALLAQPGVAQAAAFALPHPTLGEDVHAAVVAAAQHTLDPQALRQALRALLPPVAIPTRIHLVSAIPTGLLGKVQRHKLAEQFASQAQPVAASAAAATPAQQALLAIWREVLDPTLSDIDSDVFAHGANSLHLAQVRALAQKQLGATLPLAAGFDAPTVRAQSALLTPLAQHDAGVSALPRHDAQGLPLPLPVTASQRRMWLLHALDPLGSAYNTREVLRLRGKLDLSALRRALAALVRRHEAFRTRFAFAGGQPVALIESEADAALDLLRAPDEPFGDAQEAQDAVIRFCAEPFDLQRAPLWRAALAPLGEDDWILALVMHHIITDDWSAAVWLADWVELYNADLAQRAPRLPPRTVELADWAAKLARDEAAPAQQRQLTEWLQALSGLQPLALPSDTGKPLRTGSAGQSVVLPLSAQWIAALRRGSAALGLTPFMLVLGVFQAMLARWCEQDDIAVAVPVANREQAPSHTLVGALINTLILRAGVDQNLSAAQFLQQVVRPAVLFALQRQDTPYDTLVNALRQTQGSEVQPRVMCNAPNTPRPGLRWHGLQSHFLALDTLGAQFDLALTVDIDNSQSLDLTYSTELFGLQSMQRLAALLHDAIASVAAQPDQELAALWQAGRLDLALLDQVNATARPLPDVALTTLLRGGLAQAQQPALVCPGYPTLTHAELWQRAEALSAALRARGVQRGDRVGLNLPRTPALLVALLAVLDAGAAYVPLDPGFPPQRLREMAEDAGLALMLTDAEGLSREAHPAAPLLALDAMGTPLGASGAPADPAPQAQQPLDPAYIIYTSGSTGKPKGVVVPRRAVVNFLLAMREQPGMRADQTCFAVTTLSFDIAVLELLLPLIVGARVFLCPAQATADGTMLRQLLEASGAQLMQATPATWRLLLAAGWPGSTDFIALVGGEALPADLARQLLQCCAQLWNMYGPTETTVWSTCWRVQEPVEPVRIGTPIANTQVHILDPQGRICPLGFAGEIHIGGDGVALGYHRREQLSAERFIADPFHPGQRLYRTGDRGRWRADGTLEHLGRLDFQIKLRGFRIEPGDIESALLSTPQVREALVIARDFAAGDTRLVAYLVAAPLPEVSDLRERLRAQLPPYMTPQHWVFLDALPRLPNGKINRHALPAPAVEPQAAARTTLQTPAQEQMARIWRELLGADDIQPSDNFFDLGGHSLLANQVVIAFEQATGVRLGLRRLVAESLGQLTAGVELRADEMPETPRAASPKRGWLGRLVGLR
ncbi:MAG: amino acid adenylation domain-containing protein [Thiomonas sp.]